MTIIKPRPGILEIEEYVPGASKANAQKIIKLSSNENPFGPSSKAIEAYKGAAENIHRYPDSGSSALRQALAQKHNIDADRIVCGTGSDELITVICKAYCNEGDEVLFSQHGFLAYPIAALAAGAIPVRAPEIDRGISLKNILDCITAKTKIIFLANPNVPTGMMIKKDDLSDFYKKLPPSVLLVIDAAYAEYAEGESYTDGKEMVTQHENVIMLRTFSKAYGLGGMRIGWSYSSLEIANILNRVRGIFNITIGSQAAALASLGDEIYLKKSIQINSEQRTWIIENLRSLGIKVYDSSANFILFSLETAQKAADCLNFLKDRGILVRGMVAYDLPDCLRMTVGLPEDMQAVFSAMKEFISLHGAGFPVLSQR